MPATGSKSTYYNLSIRVKADGFSFIVTEGISGDNLLCQDYTVTDGKSLEDLLAEKLRIPELSTYDFTRVRVITSTDATCIPQQEFVSDNLGQLYNIVFPKIDGDVLEVNYTHLPQLDIVVAFPVSKAMRQIVREVYPDASFTNAFAVVLGRIATFCKRQQLPNGALFAYTTPWQLFLYSVGDDKLQFANSFPLDQPKDSLFYLLSVWKTLNLHARKHQCYVAGESGSVEYLAEEAKKYLQNVNVMSLSMES